MGEAWTPTTPCRRTRRQDRRGDRGARAMAACRRRWSCAAMVSAPWCWSAAISASVRRRSTAALSSAASTWARAWAARAGGRGVRSQEGAFLGAGADSLSGWKTSSPARNRVRRHQEGRFVGAWTPKHYAGTQPRSRCQQVRRCRRRDGAARAPARVHRSDITSRHVRPTLGPSASGALLQGPAGSSHRAGAIRAPMSRPSVLRRFPTAGAC